jgi:hypothetical protein
MKENIMNAYERIIPIYWSKRFQLFEAFADFVNAVEKNIDQSGSIAQAIEVVELVGDECRRRGVSVSASLALELGLQLMVLTLADQRFYEQGKHAQAR